MIRLIAAILFGSLTSLTSLDAQTSPCAVFGPTNVCLGTEAEYYIPPDSLGGYFIEFWEINEIGGNTSCAPDGVSSQEVLLVYWNCPGVFELTIFGVGPNGIIVICTTTVTVTDTYSIPINSTAALTCPANSLNGGPPPGMCEKTCAYSTVTYSVPASALNDPTDVVDWEVTGAEDYTVDGNSVTVSWGEPGSGSISAFVVGDYVQSGNLAIDCQLSWLLENGMIPFESVGVNVNIIGNLPEGGILEVFNPGGNLVNVSTVQPYASTYFLDESNGFTTLGVYNITVTNNADPNQTAQCQILISPDNSSGCGYAMQMANQDASTCFECDGSLAVNSWFYHPDINVPSPFSYVWSGGSTSNTLDNLCPGFYSVTITDAEGCSTALAGVVGCPPLCSGFSEICVDIIENPTADFTSTPAPNSGEIEICKGQTVFFNNESFDADSYIWNFGGEGASDEENPSHTFYNAGTFEVGLVAKNECLCSDTTWLTVNVLDAESPQINCVGTICANETVTYSTDADCGDFIWTVSSEGVVLEGGGLQDNFVTIQWDEGPEGSITLEVANCNTSAICLDPVIENIPIISDAVEIEGEEEVCKGTTTIYSLPDYGGAEFVWSVSAFGTIIEGQNTNNLTVFWTDELIPIQQQWVAVEFTNCYLECGGQDTLYVDILPEFFIEAPVEACAGSSDNIKAKDFSGQNINCDWEIYAPDGSLQNSFTGQTNILVQWTSGPGNYRIKAIASNPESFCKDTYTTFVEIKENPLLVNGIIGADTICPGITYTYEAVSSQANVDFAWNINGANQPSYQEGEKINISWGNSPPYTIEAFQITDDALRCRSEVTTKEVFTFNEITIEGKTSVCKEEISTYSTNSYQSVGYVWSIQPSDAGTIISGEGTSDVEVLWHQAGLATLSVEACGVTSQQMITVNAPPEPVTDHPAAICPGTTVNVTTTSAFNTYLWTDTLGNLISNTATAVLSEGFYRLEVTDDNGCVGDTIFKIDVHPNSTVTIDVPIYLGLCPGGPMATITALTSEGGFDYQWFFNGNPVVSNQPNYSTNQTGIYQVIVTDQNACTGNSNLLNLADCESIGGVCQAGICVGGGFPSPDGCNAGGFPNFEIDPTLDCNTHDFINTSTNAIPGTFYWEFGDPASGAANTSTLENPSHTYSAGPGFYPILMIAAFPDLDNPGASCPLGILKNDTIPAEVDFETGTGCPGAPIAFKDNSSFMPQFAVLNWNWDFGDPASGSANFSTDVNPSHVYANPGNYNVTLTITVSNGCELSITKTVNIKDYPGVSFNLPNENCENTSLTFNAITSGNVVSLEWDFGDPASGAANASTLANTYHAFETPGNYTISLTASNIYGCESSFSDQLDVQPNNLGGMITAMPASPICEGDTSLLTAPSGAVYWDWSTSDTTLAIQVFEEGVYEVTISDDRGCTYVPAPMTMEVTAAPSAVIQAIEYNDYGLPANVITNAYAVCEGEDVYLEVIGAGTNYSYEWSTGVFTEEISFTEERGNLLSQGTHVFTVTVTDENTGCTYEAGPFVVNVHPNPVMPLISSNPPYPICEGTLATFSVNDPDTALTYFWSNGAVGENIMASLADLYSVTAVNIFGCTNESNKLGIVEGPDIRKIPQGCFERCNPDTICLPNMFDVTDYQWYLDGNPVPAPDGNIANYVATESGSYYLELTNWLGCVATSDPFDLTLFDAFGSLTGQIYDDINKNGIIDGGDTLMSGIPVILVQNGLPIDTSLTNDNGIYVFLNIPSLDYELVIDTLNLPMDYFAVFNNLQAVLSGCDDENSADGLLAQGCSASFSSVELSACPGEQAIYDATSIPAGTTQDFIFLKADGCDSIVTVSVLALPQDSMGLELVTCENEPIEYNGQFYNAGDEAELTFVNQFGCDSIISLKVEASPTYAQSLSFGACEGETYDYFGTLIAPGEQMQFTYNSQFDCDSVVEISVYALQKDSMSMSFNACEGESITYNGTQVPAGETQDFTFSNLDGCDSIVTVMVESFSPVMEAMQLEACEGEDVIINGISIPAGNSFDFIYPDIIGGVCDSIFTVVVEELPRDSNGLVFTSCDNIPVIYDGVSLMPGSQTDFNYTNLFGCDSIMTIIVVALPTHEESVILPACENGSVIYNGDELFPGDEATYNFVNNFGCDSTVHVSVVGAQTDNTSLVVQGCEGGSIIYNGEEVLVGTEEAFTLTNQAGCDSVVTVFAVPLDNEITLIELFACENGTVTYLSDTLSPGADQEYVFTDQNGCDSIVRVNVSSLPAFDFEVTVDGPSCWNKPTGVLSIDTVLGGTPPYAYSFGEVSLGNTPSINNIAAGSYLIGVIDSNGCRYDQEVRVDAIPAIQVDFSNLDFPCERGLMTIDPIVVPFNKQGLDIVWPDGSDESTLEITQPGVYPLSVSNECETVQGQIFVGLGRDSLESLIYIPNVFSPNGDGMNNHFELQAVSGVEVLNFEIEVFDRWGNLHFRSTNIEDSWNGTMNEKALKPGVFVWYLRLKARYCGMEYEVFDKGDVTVVR